MSLCQSWRLERSRRALAPAPPAIAAACPRTDCHSLVLASLAVAAASSSVAGSTSTTNPSAFRQIAANHSRRPSFAAALGCRTGRSQAASAADTASARSEGSLGPDYRTIAVTAAGLPH